MAYVLSLKDMVNVTNGTEFVGVAHGAVIDDGEFHFGASSSLGFVLLGPFTE